MQAKQTKSRKHKKAEGKNEGSGKGPKLKPGQENKAMKANSSKLRPESKLASSVNKVLKKGGQVGQKGSVTIGPKKGRLSRRVNPFYPIKWLYGYIKSSISELKKVTWPDRKTAWRLTGTVFLFSAVMAAFLFGVDAAFSKMFEKLFL